MADEKKPESGSLFKSSLDDKPGGNKGKLIAVVVVAGLAIGAIAYSSSKGGGQGLSAVPSASAPKPVPKPDVVAPGAMARIAAATLQMGSIEGDDDEKPVHEVKVETFELDMTEVRVADYKACVDAGKCTAPNKGTYCNWDAKRDDHPVNCLDWEQAGAYCKFVGKRLPTEAEWELAARGAEARKYVWGATEPKDQLCWNGEGNDQGKSERQGTCAVASYPAGKTAAGLYDVAGNVWEWTSASYCPYDKPDCTSDERVIRGAAWNNVVPKYLRPTDRAKEKVTSRVDNVGVRCAK